MNGVDFTILAQGQTIAPVTKAAFTGMQEFLLVKSSVSSGIAQPKNPFGLIGVYVETVMGIEQATAFAQLIVNGFRAGDLGVILIECVANDTLVLATD